MTSRRPPALVYGRNPVREAIRAATPVRRIVVLAGAPDEARLREILDAAAERGIPVEQASRPELDAITHTDSHQGVVAYVGRRQYLELRELVAGLPEDALLVVLDGIQDPQNLGSICRTAEAAGAHGLVIPRHRSAEVTPAVAKASAGAVEHLAIAQVGGIPEALAQLREAGFWSVGLAAEADQDYAACRYDGRLAIVVGAEGAGLHRLVRERCDQLVRLPMHGRVGSLNASVAFAIVIYEAIRQRGAAAGK